MWISNPLASPFFVPTVATFGTLLAGGLIALLATVRFRPRRLAGSVMFARWQVWVAIAFIYGLAALGGGLPLTLLVAAVSAQGLREYARLVGLPAGFGRALVIAGPLPAPIALAAPGLLVALPGMLLLVATLGPIVARRSDRPVRQLAFTLLGWCYLAWLPAHLVLLRESGAAGPGWLIAVGLATALADVGAFTAGRLFGRRPLAPHLSPGKTWEGFAGGLIGAILGVGALAVTLPVGSRPWLVLLLGGAIGIGAAWGDLFESALKREFGVKDAGDWLPGFGGLLDRIDSLVVVAPLTYYSLYLTGDVRWPF